MVVSINFGFPPPPQLIAAAAAAASSHEDVLLYVLGDAAGQLDQLMPFAGIRHLNLNAHQVDGHEFLTAFRDLRSLTIQGHSTRPVALEFLAKMPELVRFEVRGAVRSADAIAECRALQFLACPSSKAVLQATVGHTSLQYLDLTFGSNRRLAALASIPLLRGLSVYQVRGLTGDDLSPLAHCESLTALSLGALRNVTELKALRGRPSTTLRALLLETMPNLENLEDIGTCSALTQLGLYEARPKDKRLAPLQRLGNLAHLVLGDPYPTAEIEAFDAWYSGSFRYRDKIERGEIKPAWRTPIDTLDT